MDKKPEAPSLTSSSKFLRWLDNYWYHYKWHTIIIGFLLLVVIVSTAQCASVEKTDVTIAFCGNAALGEAEMEGISKVLGDVCPTDVDGNGEKTVALGQFSIFSEAQLTENFTYYDEESGEYKLDKNSFNSAKAHNTERIKTLQNYIMTGDCALYLVSEYVYSEMFHGKVQVDGSVPLRDTSLYRTFDAVKQLPDGLMLILVHPVMGFYADADNYAVAQAYFNAVQ